MAAAFPALPQELTIYTAAETREQWLRWWHAHGSGAGPTLAVPANAVDSIDGAGLQLLVSLRHLARRHDVVLALQQPSTVLLDVCAALGAASLLETEAA